MRPRENGISRERIVVKCFFARILTNLAECGIMYLPVFPHWTLHREGVYIVDLFGFMVSVLVGVVANLISKWLDGND